MCDIEAVSPEDVEREAELRFHDQLCEQIAECNKQLKAGEASYVVRKGEFPDGIQRGVFALKRHYEKKGWIVEVKVDWSNIDPASPYTPDYAFSFRRTVPPQFAANPAWPTIRHNVPKRGTFRRFIAALLNKDCSRSQ